MSEDDDESLAKSLYKKNRRRYYFEGILLTSVIGLALLARKYGLSAQMFTNDMVGVAMYAGGMIASGIMAVRITRGLPGLGLGVVLSNALVATFVSAISILVLGALFLIPGGIVALPFSAGLQFLVSGVSRTDINGVMAFAIAGGAAAVFTAAAVSTSLTDNEEQQLISAIEQRSQKPSEVDVTIEREPIDDQSGGTAEDAAAEASSVETTHELENQLEMAAAFLGETESYISDSDLEIAQTQVAKAEKQLTRAENNASDLPDRYDALQNRAESLRSLIEQPEAITSHLDTAENCLDSASSHLTDNDINAAKKQLATAKGRLTRAEGALEDTHLPRPDRYEALRGRCNSLETSIEDAQITQPLELATECLDTCESSLAGGDCETARRQLEMAEDHLSDVDQTAADTLERYEQLRARHDDFRTSIEAREQIISCLDTAADCLETASSHLTTEDIDTAKTQLATAKGRLTRAENTATEYEVGLPDRYELLEDRCISLEETIDQIQAIEKPLDTAEACLDVCESHLSDGDVDVAQTQLSKADTHLSRVANADVGFPDRYEQLRARYDSLDDLIDQSEGFVSRLDTAAACLESVASSLPEGDLDAGRKQLATANEQLSEIEANLEGLNASPPDRHEELQARYDSLQEAINSLETAYSRFETAKGCLESATTHLNEQEFEAATRQLSTAKGRLTQAENELEEADISLPHRYETLRDRCQSMEKAIETKEARLQAETAFSTAVKAINSGYGAYEGGDLTTATSNFEAVPAQLATVRETPVRAAELSAEMSLEMAAAEAARGRIYVEMQRAEQLVADGHKALDDRDYGGAVDAYETALLKLRIATGIASDHDLPQAWELDQRQDTIAQYLENATNQHDAADEHRLETATQRLDRATRLTETAEQHLEVDDAVAAWEDIQQARDVVDDGFELLMETAADTTEIEGRASDLSERIERIAAAIPELVRVEGVTVSASKRELLTYLQELSVIFGESPTEAFIDAYGIYPASSYREVFGSWETALGEANLAPIDEQARDRRVYSRVDILDAIVDLTEEIGRVPTPNQMNDDGAVSVPTVGKRFESWETAVQLAGLETQPTLDTVRELAGGGDSTTNVPADTDTSDADSTDDADDTSATTTDTASVTHETAARGNPGQKTDSSQESPESDPSTAADLDDQPAVDTSEFAKLTNFHRDILVILAGLEGVKGLRIKEELETYYDENINHGRLYPNLDSLAEREFIEKFAIDNRSNGYRLTEKGKRHLKRRQEWQDAHRPANSASDGQPQPQSVSGDTDASLGDTRVETDAGRNDAETASETAGSDVDALVGEILDDIERMENKES